MIEGKANRGMFFLVFFVFEGNHVLIVKELWKENKSFSFDCSDSSKG